jgi:signal transduction histidine kinase
MGYSLAAGAVVVCTLLRWPLQPLLGYSNSFTLYYPAIIMVSWVAGLGPGLATGVLSALTADFFFIEPVRSLRVTSPQAAFNLLLFLCVAAALCWFTAGWRRAEWRRRAVALDNADLYRDAQEARASAEGASRSKDEFLATVSHELRTPLNAMMAWAQVIQLDRGDAQKTAAGLEIILRNGEMQARLIDDLLDISRIVSGKMRLDVREADLAAIIAATMATVQPAALAKGIRLVSHLDPVPMPLAGDPDRLQQVVWNLLSNAVKFTPARGMVDVRLARDDAQAELVVADSGVGISPDFLPHMFERFKKSDSLTTVPRGGLGLGLAIVRHLVEMHGGTVKAESPGAGRGSTFSVRLPLATGAWNGGAGPTAGAGAPPPGGLLRSPAYRR